MKMLYTKRLLFVFATVTASVFAAQAAADDQGSSSSSNSSSPYRAKRTRDEQVLGQGHMLYVVGEAGMMPVEGASSSSLTGAERDKRARSNDRKCEPCGCSVTEYNFKAHKATDKHRMQTAKWLCENRDYTRGLAYCRRVLARSDVASRIRERIEQLRLLCVFALDAQASADEISSSLDSASSSTNKLYCAICKEVFNAKNDKHVDTLRHKENIAFNSFLQCHIEQIEAARAAVSIFNLAFD